MTDQSDPSEGRRRPRRALRLGDSGAPIMTIVMLAVAGVAVLAGFVILRSITDPATGADDVVAGATSTTTTIAPTMSTFGLPSDTTTTTSTTTTAPRASKADAIVVVANASGLDGSATAMTSDLAADGYSTVPVANATGPRLEQSIVYYLDDDPGALGVARLLVEQIPTAKTLPMPNPPPLDRPLNGATVALLLGLDAAGRPLAELQTG